MMKVIPLVFVYLFAFASCCYGQQQLDAVWDDGLTFRSRDGVYKISIGGRLHYDISFLKHERALQEEFGRAGDKVEVRRARIGLQGSIRDTYEYEIDLSFENGLEFNDLRLTFLEVPLFNRLTLGHFREPFGMEENTSSNSLPFMERSLTSAFGLSRNAGIMLQRKFLQEKVSMHVGAFRITDDFGSDREAAGRHSYSGRFVLNPLVDTTASRVAHLGIGLNTRTLIENMFEVETTSESNSAPDYIDTGTLENVDRVWQIGGEAGYMQGRFTLQGEYVHAFARFLEVPDQPISNKLREFNSYYVTGTYFLGGGKRDYDTDDNTFSDISVNNSDRWKGAWEVALRYSHLNLLHSQETFTEIDDASIGLNYYLNANTRLMGNYIFSRIENKHNANILQFRFQVAF